MRIVSGGWRTCERCGAALPEEPTTSEAKRTTLFGLPVNAVIRTYVCPACDHVQAEMDAETVAEEAKTEP